MVKRVLSKKQLNALAKGRATRANNIRLRKKSSNKYGGGEDEAAALERGLAVVASSGAIVVEYIRNPGDSRAADGLSVLAESLEGVLHFVQQQQQEQ